MSAAKTSRDNRKRTQRQTVQKMAAAGVPVEMIGRALGVSANTIRRNFREELGELTRGQKPAVYSETQRAMVEAMAGFGIPQEDIARVLQIERKTLRLHFAEELATGPVKMNVRVVTDLFRMTKDVPAAAIYWTKARMGWRDRVTIDANVQGLPAVVVTDEEAALRQAVRTLSPEGRLGLRKALEELGAQASVMPGESDAVH